MKKTTASDLRRNTNKSFAIYLLGVLLVFSANLALVNLQSSMNIDGGLGAIGSTVMFASSSLSSLSITPLLLWRFDVKWCFIGTQLSFVVYAAANFFPAYYTIVPASILNGIAKGCFWLCSGKYILYFARKYEKFGTRSLCSCISSVSGYFFCVFQSCQVFGNLIPYVIFKVGSKEQSTLNLTINYDSRSHVSEVCGAKDCQMKSEEETAKYHAAEQSTIYIMMGIFVIMTIIGVICYFFVPSPDRDNMDRTLDAPHGEDNPGLDVEELDINGNINKSESKHVNEDHDSVQDYKEVVIKPGIDSLKSDIKANLWHLLNAKQLLMAPLQFQFGLHMSFVYSEVTRAYVSCVFGITEVGLCMAVYGVSSLVTSLGFGKMLARWGRRIPAAIGLSFNFGLYLFYGLWVPNEQSSVFEVYGMLFCCGVVDGSVQMITSVMAKVVFDGASTDRAQIAWIWWSNIGFTVMFAISTAICVYIKLYLMSAVLLIATATHAISEYKFGSFVQSEPDVQMDEASVQNEVTTSMAEMI